MKRAHAALPYRYHALPTVARSAVRAHVTAASIFRADGAQEQRETTATQTAGVYASGGVLPPDNGRLPVNADTSNDSPAIADDSPSVAKRTRSDVSGNDSPSRNVQVVTEDNAATARIPSKPSAREMAEDAVQPRVLPIYSRSGKLIVPPPLRGSREILVHQNEMADAAGLERIRNDSELDRLRATHQLVNLAGSASLHVNPELPANRRCARPWTVRFASDIANAYYRQFGEPLELNSAVRTISYQLRLQHVNGNAASIQGETASPHLTGQAIDFGKRGMSLTEIAWMRAYLMPLMQTGAIDVEEEFQQSCFHISVYRSYLATRSISRREDLAQTQSAPHGYHHAAAIEESTEPQD
jgi:hypothetical protein